MNTKLLSAILCLFFYSNLMASDTIPPVFHFPNGKTIRVPLGGVWVYTPPFWVSDNQTDSADITVNRSWGYNGQVNTFIKKVYPMNLVASDTNNNMTYDTVYYMVDDTVPPVINLNTPDEVCVKYRTPYNSVHPTVTDNYYNSNQVSLTLKYSDVNTNVIGTYYEEFEAVDGSGNVTIKRRIVVVKENCDNVGIDRTLKDRVHVYPVPSDGSSLNIEGLDGMEFKLSLIDANGKTVLTALSKSGVDVSHLAAGVYVLQIETAQEKIFIKYSIGL